MDTATPVRNLIEEQTVETGILSLPNLNLPRIVREDLSVPSWVVALVLLGLLLGSTWLFYRRWPWPKARSTKSADLQLVEEIDQDPNLQPRI